MAAPIEVKIYRNPPGAWAYSLLGGTRNMFPTPEAAAAGAIEFITHNQGFYKSNDEFIFVRGEFVTTWVPDVN